MLCRPTLWITPTLGMMLCLGFSAGCTALDRPAWLGGQRSSGIQQTAHQSATQSAGNLNSMAGGQSNSNPSPQNFAGNPSANQVSTAQVDAWMSQASQAERAEQLDQARGLYEQVIRNWPQHAEAHHRLAVIADRQGRYIDARVHYQQALALTPQDTSLYSDLGYSLLLQDRLADAEQTLQQAIQLDPQNSYAHSNLSLVYQRRGQLSGDPRDQQLAQLHAQQAASSTPLANSMPGSAVAQNSAGAGENFTSARTGSSLQAPPPNRATKEFMRILAEERQKIETLEATKANPVSKPRSVSMPPAPVPPNMIRDTLANIDAQAEQERRLAGLQGGQPMLMQPGSPPMLSPHAGTIQRTGGWDTSHSSNYVQHPEHAAQYAAQPGMSDPNEIVLPPVNPETSSATQGNFTPSWPQPGTNPTQLNSQGQNWNYAPQGNFATNPTPADQARMLAAMQGLDAGSTIPMQGAYPYSNAPSGQGFAPGMTTPRTTGYPGGYPGTRPQPTNQPPAGMWQGLPQNWPQQQTTNPSDAWNGYGSTGARTAPRNQPPMTSPRGGTMPRGNWGQPANGQAYPGNTSAETYWGDAQAQQFEAEMLQRSNSPVITPRYITPQ